MDVRYADQKVEKLASDYKRACRELGSECAKNLTTRIKQLESAETLEDVFPPAAGKWHWLKHGRSGHASGTIKAGLQLIVQPDNGVMDPPRDATMVTVLEVSQHYN